MKHHVIALLLFVFPYLYSMELEKLEKVPFLEKKDAVIIQQKGVYTDNYRPAGYGCLPEKLYLARRILRIGLPSSIIARKKIIECMLQAETHLSYEISLHYQTKIDELRRTVNALEKHRYPDITVSASRCIDMAFASAGGGCCGSAIGMGIACFALTIKSYVWLWCSPTHNTCVCDALLWGFPICTCCGCVTGSCCVATGVYDRIRWEG